EPVEPGPTCRTWRVPLRPGATFHDGTPLDANAVVASLARLLAPASHSPHAWLLAALKGAADAAKGKRAVPAGLRADGATAVLLEWTRPVDALDVAHLLAAPATAVVGVDRGASSLPEGSGPFVPATYAPGGERVRLEAFSRHVRGRPFADAVVLQGFPGRKEALAAFVLGNVKLSLFGRPAFGLGSPDSGAPTAAGAGTGAGAIADAETGTALADLLVPGPPRTGRKLLGAAEMRAALDLAVDRAAVAAFAVGGGSVAAAGVIPPAYPFGRIAPPAHADAAAARALLATAAARTGEPLPTLRILLSTARPHHRDVAEKLVVALRAAGLVAELDPQPHTVFLERRASGDFDLCLDEVWLPGGGDLAFPAMLAAVGRAKDAVVLFAAGTYRDLKVVTETEKKVVAAHDTLVLDFRPLRAWAAPRLHGVWFDDAARLHLEDAFWAEATLPAAPSSGGGGGAGAGAGAVAPVTPEGTPWPGGLSARLLR
ncbi:MAG TPA: ABC transporter substrate-binding protein, partial [Myxococcota bacterium]|nr:ABC transporter substrate-binding protein [Myxococcota bacterium]